MRRQHPAIATLLAPALIALISGGILAGCSSSGHHQAGATTTMSTPFASAPPIVTTNPAQSSTVAVSTTPTLPTTTLGAPTTAGPPGPGLCIANTLSGTFAVIPGSAGAGHVEALLVLTNTGKLACHTGGYAGMQLVGASDIRLPTNVVRDNSKPVTSLVVAPSASVSALARFSPDVPGQGDVQGPSCQPVAFSTLVIAPNDTSQILVHGPKSSVCELGTIDLQPLQAGSNASP